MHIKCFDLIQFRNFKEYTKLYLSEGLNFFKGRNGQGKSNLIEALHILSNGRSFRSARPVDLINWNNNEAAISCAVITNLGDLNLRVIIKDRRQEYYVNDHKVSGLSKFIGHLPTVSFNPDDLELVKAGPEGRRNLFDKYIVLLNPDRLNVYTSYQKALRSKNFLLKNSTYRNIEEIHTWNQILSENGAKIVRYRKELAKDINPVINQIHREFINEDSDLLFDFSNDLIEDQEHFFDKYKQIIKVEQDRRTTLFGPHRDDITILLNQRLARTFASQGQARSIVLALKLALIEILEIKINDSPVVLLDDVDSELDQYRSQGFFDLLMTKKRQVLITGTDFSTNKIRQEMGAKVFGVEIGTISIIS